MEENIVLKNHNDDSQNRNIQNKKYIFCWFGTPEFVFWCSYLGQYRELVFHFFFSKAGEYPPLMSENSNISRRLNPEVFQSTMRTFKVKEISYI